MGAIPRLASYHCVLHVRTYICILLLIPQWDGPNCPDNRTSCYDEVDLSLCFEDSAIFYGIVALFLFLAVFWFISAIPVVCGSQTRPSIPIGLLHVAKLVSRVATVKSCSLCLILRVLVVYTYM